MGVAGYKARRASGQAIVEMAVILPVLIFGLTMAIDLGRYMTIQSTAASAVDFAARTAEAEPDLGESALQDAVRATYPALGEARVTLTAAGRVEQPVGHRLYDPETDSFKTRASKVATDRYIVAVEAEGEWFSPGLLAAYAITGSDGRFHVKADSVANIDATLEEW